MAINDIVPYKQGASYLPGSKPHQVASGGTPPAINAGEPVSKTAGNQYVITMATSKPLVTDAPNTTQVAGIAATSSTETTTLDGSVEVFPVIPGCIWLISPNVAATWNTQALYNALVGARVTFNKTTGTYTINSADGAGNGLVVENLNIAKYPGKVAFSIRQAQAYTA